MKAAVITGGVGGAKFVLGLTASGVTNAVTAIVNVGDDFDHLGLRISPDIDTLLYTLSGQANRAQGWGREGETWAFMEALKTLGGPDWFALGDGDLALHVLRTQRLRQGEPLSSITADAARRWGIAATILPASDDPVATMVDTADDTLSFQHYFVRERCVPAVRAIRFDHADQARPAPGVAEAILAADLVFIAPSNPYLSVDPVLAVTGIADALKECRAPVVAISPIVGGAAVKGPTAKIMSELGLAADNQAIADHYRGLIDGLIIDARDEAPGGVPSRSTNTLMRDLDDKIRLAREAVDFGLGLAR